MKSGLFKNLIWLVVVFVLIFFVWWGISRWQTKTEGEEQLNIANTRPAEKIFSIGKSVNGLEIKAYQYGSGKKHLLLVGGIHGGYEWNSVLLAYELIDYINHTSDFIPNNLIVTIIPSLNPDGLYKATSKIGRFEVEDITTDEDLVISGRFNANDVDLNRNFDCKWEQTGIWRGKEVSAGKSPFSEPEAKALRDFVLQNNPTAVVFWHSQSNAVYASECENGILPETIKIMNLYSEKSGYPKIESFDSYVVTGDAEGWLASIEIPAITVELKTHESIEWEKNLEGIKALFEFYQNQ